MTKTERAFEELVAELGSSFLCAEHGIQYNGVEGHAAYIATWLTVLENDENAIFKAASLADKAARYLSPDERHDTDTNTRPKEEQLAIA